MTKSGKRDPAAARESVQCQTALVTRIALFLRLLSKENFQKLLQDTAGRQIASEGDLLKLMTARGYINPKDVPGLKKTCLSFARAQKDTRFGSLCIEFGFLTQSNLDLALEEQKTLGDDGRTIFLGDLLVEAGMLSEQQQKLILQKQKMDHSFQESSPNSSFREIRDKGIILYLPENGLRVHGIRDGKMSAYLNVTLLKDILEGHGIIYGVASDDQLERFLSDDSYTATRFELAKGLEPLPGKDAQIFYLFEQNYLSAGHLGDDGIMDYKRRGHIPFVNAGDILAEKVPPKTGRDGVDVFGDVVEAVPPLDMDIFCGKGVSLSENRLRAFAGTDGYPKLSPDGTLSVNDAHIIRGDVDFTTGHVKFTKNVFITGTIKAGFKVEALDVVVREVDGGIIVAKGDVAVANGITNATIDAEGSISAGFIHRSSIGCIGDMEVTQEVVESSIALEGTFEMSRGKMYASTISARGGAKIYHIGSIKTVPSNIEVGTSPYLNRAIKALNLQIEQAQAALEERTREKETSAERMPLVEKEIARLNKVSRNDSGNGPTSPEGINDRIIALRAEQRLLEKRLRDAGTEIDRLQEQIKELVGKKFNLEHKTKATPPKPILDVRGQILAGTTVRGQYSSTAISRDLARVRIMEMSCTNEQSRGKRIWEMVTTRL